MAPQNLKLIDPTSDMAAAYFDMLADYQAAGETDHFWQLRPYGRRRFGVYVQSLYEAAAGRGLRPGWVSSNLYWLIDRGQIVGECTLRHFLTASLLREGGHIGYRIRPSRRRQGYGTAILRLALGKARNRGLTRVLVTCDTDNFGSSRIIIRNGGQFAGEAISDHSGKPVSRYWITLLDSPLSRFPESQAPSTERVLTKVTAFVTWGDRLLLFRHPHAGIQVPAGTVEAYESVENAVFREVYEEGRIANIRLRRHLGCDNEGQSESRRCVWRDTVLRSSPAGGQAVSQLRRGAWVIVSTLDGARVQARPDTVDLSAETNRRPGVKGWLDLADLATAVERHFFQLDVVGTAPEQWHSDTDGHRFELFWSPLAPRPRLAAGQDEWLGRWYSALLSGEGTGDLESGSGDS